MNKCNKRPWVVAFGDNVVDCYADRGEMYPGGNTLNLSVFVRRSGGHASYVGAVADDAAGRHIRNSLAAEGVDISGLRTLPGSTAFCVIGNSNGDREFLGADLGVSMISPEPADLKMIAAADAVHTGRSSHADRFLEGFSARAKLSFDFAVIRDPGRIARIAPHCFLASFSGGDLTKDGAEALLQNARAAGATWVLVTRGGDGALLAGPDGTFATPAASATLTDTLGAGDTFIARTLLGLLREEEPGTVLTSAARMSAETCGQRGGFGHPAPLEVDQSLAKPLSEIYLVEEAQEAARA